MTYKQLEKKNQFIHKRDHKEPSDICLNFQPLLYTLSLCLLHTIDYAGLQLSKSSADALAKYTSEIISIF